MPACFFCSRPASEGVLEPSTLDVQGRRRRVLACRACTEELRQGRMPRVRVVHDGGNEVPWFRSSTYDPRRDWTRRDYGARDVTDTRGFLDDRSHPPSSIVYVDDDRLVHRRTEAPPPSSRAHRSEESDTSPTTPDDSERE